MFKTYESDVKKKKLFFGKLSFDTLQTEPGLASLPNYANIFVSKWVTTTFNETIILPYESNGFYDGTIDWGDGKIVLNNYYNRTHIYEKPGTYQIEISGNVVGFKFNNTGSKNKIVEILNWGKLRGLNNSNLSMFYGCTNLKLNNVSDSLNLIGVNNISSMFYNCTSITTINNINNWDTSSVTDMSGIFIGATNFNQDISNWDVSKVMNMTYMFYLASSFNQNLSNWNVSACTAMNGMFFRAASFNQYLGDWNISNVSSMNYMLNQSGLNVLNYSNTLIGWASLPSIQSNVTLGASGLIYSDYAKYARNTLTAATNNWTILQDIRAPFISEWRTTQINEQIQLPYWSAGGYTGTIDWGDGTFSNNNYNSRFHTYTNPGRYVIKISGDVTGFKFSLVPYTNARQIVEIKQWGPVRGNPASNSNSEMFEKCDNLTLSEISDIINLNQITNINGMFKYCDSITQINNLENWKTDSVQQMESVFLSAFNFNQNLGSWNVSGVTSMYQILKNTGLSSQNYSDTLIGWSSLPILQSGVSLGANNLKYQNIATTARNVLTNTYLWNITDSGLV